MLQIQLNNQAMVASGVLGGGLPVPVLVYDGIRTISWSVAFPTVPTTAKIEQSSDGISWSTYATVPWANGSQQIVSDFLYRVTGLDAISVPDTQASNSVTVPLNMLATSWRSRVQTNGGAAPSTATVRAISDFSYHLDANALTSLIITCSVFAPDNFIASITPLIVNGADDPWHNGGGNFSGADLDVNGLKGDGLTKFLSMGDGVFPSIVYSGDNSTSLFVYESTTDTNTTAPLGAATNNSTRDLAMFTNSFGAGIALYDCWDNTDNHGRCVVNPGPALAGFFLGTRTAANLSSIYFANSGNPWALQATNVGTSDGTHADVNHAVGVFCLNATSGAGQFFLSSRKISFAGMGRGMTSAQGQALYNGIQALRQTFGGGFV